MYCFFYGLFFGFCFCLLYVNYTYITLFWFNNLYIHVPFLCLCNIVCLLYVTYNFIMYITLFWFNNLYIYVPFLCVCNIASLFFSFFFFVSLFCCGVCVCCIEHTQYNLQRKKKKKKKKISGTFTHAYK